MTVKVLRRAGDISKPATIEMDTALNIGDRFEMEYDWCTQKECMNGYKAIWHKDIAEFRVVDIICNMLINPSSLWLRLDSDDETFQKRCGGGSFDAPEEQVLERIKIAENKRKERKEAV